MQKLFGTFEKRAVRRLNSTLHQTNQIVIYQVNSVICLLNNPGLRSLGVASNSSNSSQLFLLRFRCFNGNHWDSNLQGFTYMEDCNNDPFSKFITSFYI